MEPVIDVRLGAFPDILADVAPESARLVVADPPWNDLDAWSAIGAFAARVLEPNGTLLAYIGNRRCFEAIERLSAHLQPVRLAYLPTPHEDPWDPTVRCHEAGSFMVIMANGTFSPVRPWSTVVEATVQGMQWHPFQRPVANVRHYVEAFTEPGDLVVDPFIGFGTTAVACALTGRSFVGCDITPEYFDAAVVRLEQLRGTTTEPATAVVDASSSERQTGDDAGPDAGPAPVVD